MTGTTDTCADNTVHDTQWQQLLDSYCSYEQRHKRLLQWRALSYAILIYSAGILFFLLGAASHYQSYWFIGAISGIVVTLPLTLCCQLALRRIGHNRNHISRELFIAGLRIDENHRLLTNTAHPRLVAKPSRLGGNQ